MLLVSYNKYNCLYCGGVGRVPSGICNCGSGEGCSVHNTTAIAMWGVICSYCNGKGMKEGANLHRQNEKSVKGIWRCEDHNNLPICQRDSTIS